MTISSFKDGDYPEVAAMWHPTKNGKRPEDVTSGSSAKAWFKCEHGHEFDAAPRDMTRRTGGCPVCSHKRVLAGYNDLATIHPDVAADWDSSNPFGPHEVTSGSNKMVRWTGAECGHAWEARVKSRSLGTGCPYCNGHKALKNFNDAATKFPHLVPEYSSNNPLPLSEFLGGSNARVEWVCRECNHMWKTSIKNRTAKSTGCPSCRRAGRSK